MFTSSIYTIFGTALHETLQHYLNIMYNESFAAADRFNFVDFYEDKLREEYKKQYKSNNNQHFSSSEELREFFEDGVEIINYFKKKKNAYFSKRGWYLVGCEVPIILPPKQSNVLFQGFLDVVMYHEPTNTFKIIDIKTSTRGWNDLNKKDETKQNQLILYKNFFSKQYNIPIESIDIEFFIVKRKVPKISDFPISRIQRFVPTSGKVKINKAINSLNNFLNEAFSGSLYVEKEYKPNPTKWNCSFCPFLNTKFCKEGIS
jgi:hypothetical protein